MGVVRQSGCLTGCLVLCAVARATRAHAQAPSALDGGGLGRFDGLGGPAELVPSKPPLAPGGHPVSGPPVEAAADSVLPVVEVPVEAPGDVGVAPVARDARDPSAPVTRVDARAREGEASSTAALIETAPGVSVHRLGDLGQLATVALRGSSTDQIQVLLDGVPLTSAAGGTVDLSTIPEALIDHIDVLRGDAAARYGAGALGGVINVVTRHPGPDQAEAELGYGAFGTLSLSAADGLALGAAADGGAGPAASVALSLLRSDGTFSYRYSPTPDLPVAPQVRVRANNQSLALGGVATGRSALAGGEAELVLDGAFLDRGLAGTVYFPTPTDHATEGRGLFGAKWVRPAVLGPFALELSALGRVDSYDVRLAGPGSAHQLDLASGAELALTGTVGGGWVTQGLTAALAFGDEALSAQAASPARGTISAVLADRIALLGERLWLVPSVRAEAVGSFGGVSPKLGVSFFPVAPLELRASVARGFRAPTFGELVLQQGIAQPNPTLQPETNVEGELGAALSLGVLRAQLTGFWSKYDNLILYELFPPMSARPFNEGASFVQGLEAEVEARPVPWVTLSASYTFLSTWDDDPHSFSYGQPLPDRPTDHLHCRAAFRHGRFSASVEADLLSSQYLNRAASLAIPGHAVLDAAVGLRVWDRPEVWFTATARNLTDAQVPDTFGYPLPGTALFASLRVSENASDNAPAIASVAAGH